MNLPEKLKEAMLLVYAEGMNHKEAAASCRLRGNNCFLAHIPGKTKTQEGVVMKPTDDDIRKAFRADGYSGTF